MKQLKNAWYILHFDCFRILHCKTTLYFVTKMIIAQLLNGIYNKKVAIFINFNHKIQKGKGTTFIGRLCLFSHPIPTGQKPIRKLYFIQLKISFFLHAQIRMVTDNKMINKFDSHD